ncbi:MAG: DNA repair protein RecO C-terminal domain-containing protein, partial [Clostridia bacterium]
LKGLCYDNLNPKLVLILFLNKIISGFGYRLNLDKCSTCAAPFVSKRFLNVDNGDIVCFSCKDRHAVEISAGCHSIFRILSGCDYCKLSTVSFPETCVIEALKMLETVFEQHFSKKLSFMF